jgi:hypothetical protein
MIHQILLSNSFAEGSGIKEVTGHNPNAARLELRSLAGGARKRGHPHVLQEQGFDQMTAHEAGGSGDQGLHSCWS